MPAISLKAVPARLHRQLKARAARHQRSLNQEVLAVLEEAVAPARRLEVAALQAGMRQFRARLGFTTSQEEIDQFKRAGRQKRQAAKKLVFGRRRMRASLRVE